MLAATHMSLRHYHQDQYRGERKAFALALLPLIWYEYHAINLVRE